MIVSNNSSYKVVNDDATASMISMNQGGQQRDSAG